MKNVLTLCAASRGVDGSNAISGGVKSTMKTVEWQNAPATLPDLAIEL